MPLQICRALFLGLLGLVLQHPVWAGPARTPEQHQKVDDFVAFPLGMGTSQTLGRMRSFDKVLSEKSRMVPNAYRQGAQDEVRTFEYDGLVLQVLFVGRSPSNGLLWETDITKPRWAMKHGLKVGSTVAEVQKELGEPDERAPGQLKYCGDRACGVFYLDANRVTRAVFTNAPE